MRNMLDFRRKFVIMEKQFHNRQFGTILSLNKTTGKTSIKTTVFIEGAVPRCARTKPGRNFARRKSGTKYRFLVSKIRRMS